MNNMQNPTDDYQNSTAPEAEQTKNKKVQPTEPLPERERPRQDGPGGN